MEVRFLVFEFEVFSKFSDNFGGPIGLRGYVITLLISE
jgi:hypothetical protein